jgi:predicted GIY-YIG superfamily endonuclease
MAVAYILYSEESDSYFKGSAEDMDACLLDHNSGKIPYTKPGIPWRVVWVIDQENMIEARKTEWKLKNILTRAKLLAFIESNSGT